MFTRRDLAKSGATFAAAANLSHLLTSLGARNTRDVFDHVPPSALVLPRLGVISFAVLGAAFELKGLGGDAPLETWIAKHRPKDAADTFVTFDTMKHQETAREPGEARARAQRRARKGARRDKAQRLRVERFTTRHTAGVEATHG